MKKNKSIIISIIIVALIIILVGGATYAYWQWQSTNEQQTNISVTIPGQGSITMTIDGGGNITTKKLAPAQCTNDTYAIQRKVKVTASNNTGTAMTGTIGLTVAALTPAHGSLDAANKEYIRYALVSTTQSEYEAATFTKSADACATGAVTSGNFSTFSASSTITLANNIAIAGTGTTNAYYELYLWIDKDYPGVTTVGTTVTDPLQDLTINLTWTGSMTNQT